MQTATLQFHRWAIVEKLQRRFQNHVFYALCTGTTDQLCVMPAA